MVFWVYGNARGLKPKLLTGNGQREGLLAEYLPIGPKVVPFWGSYLEFYKVIPKRNYFGAYR